ncbi:MAG: glutathione synthase [Gammaproteobacteria bacterium]|nr:glutathione synthase [Gammaproteobacteria bacterium]
MEAIKIGVVMDPIEKINTKKDSSFAMMLSAQKKNWEIYYIRPQDLYISDSQAHAISSRISVIDEPESWFQTHNTQDTPLSYFDTILMRQDPPFNMDYIYVTYLLEMAENDGVLVVNKAASIRDHNEKLFTSMFPQCCVPNLVSCNMQQLKQFVHDQQDVILKPLDGMGGASIFRVRANDPNLNVIIETLTEQGRKLSMAQQFIPDIVNGDKRILLIDGEPVPFALARIPSKGETRGNLAAGGSAKGQPLTERDYWICQQVGPTLKEKGLLFVGIDVIGDFLTEINVTSPTCIRELDQQFNLDIATDLMNIIEKKLRA